MANLQLMQQQADAYNQQLGQYNKEATQFRFDADVYNKQLKEYQALVDAYNAKLDVYNKSEPVVNYQKQVETYNSKIPAYQSAVDAYNKKVNDWSSKVVRFTNGNLYQDATPAQMANLINSGKIHPNSPNGQAFSGQLNQYLPGAAPIAPTAPKAPAAFTEQKPGDFTAVKPELTAVMPKDPGFTGQQMKQLLGQKTVAQQEREDAGGDVGLIQQALGRKKQPDSIIGGMLQNVRYST